MYWMLCMRSPNQKRNRQKDNGSTLCMYDVLAMTLHGHGFLMHRSKLLSSIWRWLRWVLVARIRSNLVHLAQGPVRQAACMVQEVVMNLLTWVFESTGENGRKTYSRLDLSAAPTDPFCGIFLGSFGGNGLELLQIERTTDKVAHSFCTE